MKKTRFIISLAVTVLLLVSGIIVSQAADTIPTYGDTGTCQWNYSGGKLTITSDKGGKMADYTTSSLPDWYTYYASSITKIEIANEVEYIGNYAFYNLTKVTSVTIGTGVEKIGSFAFRNCTNLSAVNYNAEKCETAGTKTTMIFYDCNNLTTINFGEGIKYIPSNLLLYCRKITSVTIPESVYKIGEYAFGYCYALTEVVLPDNLAEISPYSFYNCSAISSINVPTMLSNIGNYAFYNCSSITEMTLPATVTEIGYGAFDGCTNITIKTTKGSYAELFANQYGITCDAGNSLLVNLTVNTSTQADFGNGYLLLKIKFDQPLDGECVHAALYDANGKVVNYFIFPVSGGINYMGIPIDIDYIFNATYAKVFIWDSMESCMPVSPAETIELYPSTEQPLE
ncbi:MAG: leucine-rich repeat domain-containing protein [Clostridia bacterium]|nr:leucine-rich repeat domain-containing protein [Clostridia bacterium]